MKTESQTKMIYDWMKEGKPINPMAALEIFGCFRLGARIYDIEQKFDIEVKRQMIYKGEKKWMQYWL
jgi:hypothetical protein